jgi:ATP-dependent exoDNAse (exonuclease V) beta subunit
LFGVIGFEVTGGPNAQHLVLEFPCRSASGDSQHCRAYRARRASIASFARMGAVPEEIEEERRLLYVAMTRAKNDLDLIVPQRFFTHQQSRNGDRHVYASVSRFIPDKIHHLFDRRSWREVSDVAKPSATRPERVVNVTASLKRMWR